MATSEPDFDLSGLRVLITRPAGRAEALIERLREWGAEVLHLPMLRIAALDPKHDAVIYQPSWQRLLDLDRYHKLIFISANAVEYGAGWVEQCWPQWPAGQQIFAIGEATAAALAARDLAVTDSGVGAMDSESLLALPALQSVAGQRIAIFRGVGGRETLADTLRERGAEIDYLECYRRLPPTVSSEELQAALSEHAINCGVVNSGETLEHLTRLLPVAHSFFDRPLIVPGERVAVLAGKLGYARVFQADNAGTAATLAALHALRHHDE